MSQNLSKEGAFNHKVILACVTEGLRTSFGGAGQLNYQTATLEQYASLQGRCNVSATTLNSWRLASRTLAIMALSDVTSDAFVYGGLTCLMGSATPDGSRSKSDNAIPSATITRTTDCAAVLAVPRVTFTGIRRLGVRPLPCTFRRLFSETTMSYRARIWRERAREGAGEEVRRSGRVVSNGDLEKKVRVRGDRLKDDKRERNVGY